jgi:hypothetical protein
LGKRGRFYHCRKDLDVPIEEVPRKYFRRRARELADTGRFERRQGIEFEMRFVEGVREASVWLGSEPLREELDILCQRAKSRPKKTPT